MINKLHLAHWGLVTVAVVSSLQVGRIAWELLQTNKVNNFINSEMAASDETTIPAHEKAQFAQAFYEAKNKKYESALARLTGNISTADPSFEAAIYYNRANIHLREAKALPSNDTGRVALVGLAKQDYRNALLVDSSLWDARFNLEYALLMVPEEAAEVTKSEWGKKGSSRVVVKAVGFRVDLP